MGGFFERLGAAPERRKNPLERSPANQGIQRWNQDVGSASFVRRIAPTNNSLSLQRSTTY
jgi:hypothetical protein